MKLICPIIANFEEQVYTRIFGKFVQTQVKFKIVFQQASSSLFQVVCVFDTTDSSPLSLWRYDSDELTERYRFIRQKSRSVEPGDVELIQLD